MNNQLIYDTILKELAFEYNCYYGSQVDFYQSRNRLTRLAKNFTAIFDLAVTTFFKQGYESVYHYPETKKLAKIMNISIHHTYFPDIS